MNVKQTLSAALASIGIAVAVPALAFAATPIKVSDLNSNGWTTAAPVADNRPGGSVQITDQYGAPAGFGSSALELKTSDGSAKAQAMYTGDNGTLLNTINDISYNTYRSAGSGQQVAAINVGVDINGSAAGGFTTLVYEPVYNTSQGTVQDNTWQHWDAGDSTTWWSSNPINVAPNRDTFVSLAAIKAANPDAVVLYYGLNQGSGNAGLTSAVDGLTVGSKTFDFELKPVKPTDKEQCKNGGWKDDFQTHYKNQGDCVSSVVSNKDKGTQQSFAEKVKNLFF